MKSYSTWLLCLVALILLNQVSCRPNVEDYYQGDGEGDDYTGDEDYEDEDLGPPPEITSKPITLTLDEGDMAIFPCNTTRNDDTFSRVWRKDLSGLYVGSVRQTNNDRIKLHENGSLEVENIQRSDSGAYSCMISAQKPQEVIHMLHVNSPAKIVSISPNDSFVTIKQTGTLTLICIAEGFPTPSIKWFRNDHVLEDQDPSIHGARYTIDNASMEDAGFYKCTATNGQQVPDEKTIEVEVRYPPEIKIAKAIVPTGEGYESELMCTVTGHKKPEVKWYKDGDARKPVVSSQRIKLERNGNDHILKVLKTQKEDFGDYICEAKNTEGSREAIIRLTGHPSQPVIESIKEEGNKIPVLTYKVESYAPIEEYELLYKRQEKDEWVVVKPTVTSSPEGRIFTVKHTLTDTVPGVYVAQLKAKNNYGWSEFSSVSTFPREHDDDLIETEQLASANSAAIEQRISAALVISSLLVAHFYC
uniref:Ig-like domain-containing protein n=1 Tax=Homalodisca liturata TaxID=320908 RepID=A0A1B6HW17_9HEMI